MSVNCFPIFHKFRQLSEEKDHPRTIACDFDGTLATYDGWKGPEHFGEPIKRTIDALKKEKENGSRIIIHTCRTNPKLTDDKDVLDMLGEWLTKNDVPHDEIWVDEGKPIADEYWDDRAINVKDIK
jgi:hypothetical protein